MAEQPFSSRKNPRLLSYDYSQCGGYFVTICTQDRRQILSKICREDPCGRPKAVPSSLGQIAIEELQNIAQKFNIQVDCYVIMPDHIHLLLRFDRDNGTGNPSPTLGNVIGWYKYQVTKQANTQLNNLSGKLFQRSYYDHVIRNQQDYNEAWNYIENNPRKWVIQRHRDA